MEQFIQDINVFNETFFINPDNQMTFSQFIEREFDQSQNGPHSRKSHKSTDSADMLITDDKENSVHLYENEDISSPEKKKDVGRPESDLTDSKESQCPSQFQLRDHDSQYEISKLRKLTKSLDKESVSQKEGVKSLCRLQDESAVHTEVVYNFQWSSLLHLLKWFLIATMLLVLATLLVVEYLHNNKTAESYVVSVLSEKTINYIFLTVRHIGLFFFTFKGPPIAVIQDHGCLIANPLHYEGTIPESYCHLCKGINSILTPKSKAYPQPVDGEVLTGLRPLIFRKWGHRATLLELHEQIAENIHILERFPSFFSSNVGYVKRIQDFAKPHTINRLLGDPRVQLTWTGHRYMTSQIIRKLFQRPKFLSRDIKVQVPQKIFIDGRDAPPYYIGLHDVSDPEVTGEFSHVYYAQGSGSRIIVLKFKGCTSCQPLLARMRSQDILVFNGQFWSAYSQPYGTSTSYGVTGSFFSQNAWIML